MGLQHETHEMLPKKYQYRLHVCYIPWPGDDDHCWNVWRDYLRQRLRLWPVLLTSGLHGMMYAIGPTCLIHLIISWYTNHIEHPVFVSL